MPDNLNLTPERGPNVWDRDRDTARTVETISTAVAGAVMLGAAATTAFFGGRMLYRAIKGVRGQREESSGRRGTPLPRARDIVVEESEESFPASDAPSWTAAEGATPETRRRR